VIDLGAQHIASIFVSGDVPDYLDRPYPLEVVRCAAPDGCGLVQLRHSIAPRVLYSNYGYRSGTNELMRANLHDIARQVENLVQLQPGDTVLDIGCNDGTLLTSYETTGLDKVGIDPAPNVAEVARTKGLDVVNDFFSARAFRGARPDRQARVVTSIAMFYDLEAPMRFVADVASVLADDGVWVIELSYLPTMLERNSFDTVCHEHLEYYALRQIEWMLEKHGLRVHRLQMNDVNGGSFRLFIRKAAAGDPTRADAAVIAAVREQERELALDSERPYAVFREHVDGVRDELVTLLRNLKRDGKRVYVYGASTKGNTILQFCGIDHTLVEKAADRNPDKWGRRTLGTDIPIVSEEQARGEAPEYFLVLPWHFVDGFFAREADFLARGGKFILPLPHARVVGANAS